MRKSDLYDCSDAYILVKWTIIIAGIRADVAAQNTDARNEQVALKICTTFTDCISKINNTWVGNTRGIMPWC